MFDVVAGGGDVLNAHSKGLNNVVGLSSTAGSTVDHRERRVLQQQQQHGKFTVQCHPLARGGPVQNISSDGDAVGGGSTKQTAQNSTGQTQ